MTILCSFGPSIPTLHPASPFNSLIWCFSFVLYFSTELVRKDWCIACTKDWPWRTHCTHFENLKSTYLIVDCHWLSFLIPLNILYHRAINTMNVFCRQHSVARWHLFCYDVLFCLMSVLSFGRHMLDVMQQTVWIISIYCLLTLTGEGIFWVWGLQYGGCCLL